jgi:hypothetical protein
MCDITQERERIEAILDQTLGTAMLDRRDEDSLVETGLLALREHYGDICSEECMRARCEAFVARLKRQRWLTDGMTPELMSAYMI